MHRHLEVADFRLMAEAIPHLIWVASSDGKLTFCNRKWVNYTGADINVDGSDSDITFGVHPDDLSGFYERWNAAWHTGDTFEAEYRFRRHDGVYQWFLGKALPMTNKEGRIYEWHGTATNIDTQKRAEQHRRFLDEITLELSSSLDSDRILEVTGRVASGLSDWCCIQVQGEDKRLQVASFIHHDPQQARKLRKILSECRLTDNQFFGPLRVVTTGKFEFYPEIPPTLLTRIANSEEQFAALSERGFTSAILVPIPGNEKPLGVISMVLEKQERRYDQADLSFALELARRVGTALENARMYSELNSHKESLVAALKVRDEFLSVASHELKTPLAALKLQLQITKRRQKDGAAVFNDRAEGQIARLSRLIDDMIDISRIQTGRLSMQKEEFDLCQIVHGVLETMTPVLETSGCTLVCATKPNIVGRWDRFRLEQVVLNLLTNAVRYGPGAPVKVRAYAEAGFGVISVQDQGRGIAKEDQERIFQRFERAVSSQEIAGMGLGLYITKQIVEMHGGKITVESTPGEGATFEVRLPLGV